MNRASCFDLLTMLSFIGVSAGANAASPRASAHAPIRQFDALLLQQRSISQGSGLVDDEGVARSLRLAGAQWGPAFGSGFHNLVTDRVAHEIADRAETQLSHDVRAVGLNRLHADPVSVSTSDALAP
jgi:hypothetical protein